MYIHASQMCLNIISSAGVAAHPPRESQMHIHASQMCLNWAILRRSRRASPARVSIAHLCVSNVSQSGFPPPESPRIPRRSLKCTFMRLKCVSIGLSSAGVAAHPPAGVSNAHSCVSNVSQSGFPPPESPRIPPPESQMCLNWAILRRSRRASPLRIYLGITHY